MIQSPGFQGRVPRRKRPMGLAAFWLCLLAALSGAANEPKGNQAVYRVDIEGVIGPATAGLLENAIHTAEANNAAALIVRINTPGGLLSSTRDMVGSISESHVPVIGYVGPSGASATSAGAFILLSTHLAIMNTGTNVGASSPVTGTGGDIEGTMAKKVMNDTRAFMRSVASSRGRNVELAESFVSEANSLSAREAEASKVVDLTVDDFSMLLQAAHGRQIRFRGELMTLDVANREIREVEPRLVHRLLQLVAHPQIAHMLISLGFLAIYVEILSPGLAFPGIFGAISLVLGLVGIQTLPVNTGFLILMVLGIALMIAELFVAGIGVLGIGGAAAFVLGSINLFDTPMTEGYQDTILWVSIGVSAAIGLSAVLISRSIFSGSKASKSMEGKLGEAMVNFEKNGYVLVEEQRWPAETIEPLHHGDLIVVVGQDDQQRLIVKKAK